MIERYKKYCSRCELYIKTVLFETGEEDYCDCQSTLDANFNNELWIEER